MARYLVDLGVEATNLVIAADDDATYITALAAVQDSDDPNPGKPRYEVVGFDDPRITNVSHGVSGTTVTTTAKLSY